MGRPLIIRGSHPYTTLGSPMITRQVMVLFRRLINTSPWVAHGSPVGHPWAVRGSPVHRSWITRGSMGHTWVGHNVMVPDHW